VVVSVRKRRTERQHAQLRDPDPAYASAAQRFGFQPGAAASLGVAIEVLKADTDGEIDAAFASIPQQSGCGMISARRDIFMCDVST
jgi:hypothetical protein